MAPQPHQSSQAIPTGTSSITFHKGGHLPRESGLGECFDNGYESCGPVERRRIRRHTKGTNLARISESKPVVLKSNNYNHGVTSEQDQPPSVHELRVRASSPLLGHSYRASPPSATSLPRTASEVHKSGSWSNLRLRSIEKAAEPHQNHSVPVVEFRHGRATSKGHVSGDAEYSGNGSQKNLVKKDSKWKLRARKIDLSLFFPKPNAPTTPLLSPRRLTRSPSPVASVTSDYSLGKPRNADWIPKGNRFMKPPSQSRSSSCKRPIETLSTKEPIPPIPKEKRQLDWFDAPWEKLTGCDEDSEIVQLDNLDSPQQAAFPSDHHQFRDSGFHSQNGAIPRGGQPKSSSIAARITSPGNPVVTLSPDLHLSPTPVAHFAGRLQNSIETWQVLNGSNSPNEPSQPISKRKGQSTLANCDLTKFSVLSLSSSEDEDEDDSRNLDDEEEIMKPRQAMNGALRDSVSTFGDFEPEICTAEAVRATKGPQLTHLEKSTSVRARFHRPHSRQSRTCAPASPEASSLLINKSQSNPSESSPASEPNSSEGDLRRSVSSKSQLNNKRRSRLVAVTQQEESLLEAMRERNGRITPSLFNGMGDKSFDRETGRVLSPSSGSAHQRDASFLRLSSTVLPTSMSGFGNRDAISKGTDPLGSRRSASDTRDRLRSLQIAPHVSLALPDSHNLPPLNPGSPLAPASFPRDCFSPSAILPPLHAPHQVPNSQRRHSRRRTDSSETLALEGERQHEEEFPIWASQWNQDTAHLAMVH